MWLTRELKEVKKPRSARTRHAIEKQKHKKLAPVCVILSARLSVSRLQEKFLLRRRSRPLCFVNTHTQSAILKPETGYTKIHSRTLTWLGVQTKFWSCTVHSSCVKRALSSRADRMSGRARLFKQGGGCSTRTKNIQELKGIVCEAATRNCRYHWMIFKKRDNDLYRNADQTPDIRG